MCAYRLVKARFQPSVFLRTAERGSYREFICPNCSVSCRSTSRSPTTSGIGSFAATFRLARRCRRNVRSPWTGRSPGRRRPSRWRRCGIRASSSRGKAQGRSSVSRVSRTGWPRERYSRAQETGFIYPPNERAEIVAAGVTSVPAAVAAALGIHLDVFAGVPAATAPRDATTHPGSTSPRHPHRSQRMTLNFNNPN